MVYFYGMHKEGGLREVQKKRVLVMSTLLVAIILLGIGTIAYFRRMVNGNITGQAGNLVLIVNEANAVDNETFTITLKRSEEENFIMPDDKGTFDLNIDATGSTSDVTVTAVLSRVNLPNNLRFYLDENYEEELSTNSWVIEKADTMTKTVPIYWYWDGSIDDENHSDFINTEITANISVSASISKTLYDTLMSLDKTVDTDVDFAIRSSEIYSIENYANGTNSSFYFAARTRLNENTTVTPSLTCSRDMDRFIVDSANGNGDLTYPAATITLDEMILSGLDDGRYDFSEDNSYFASYYGVNRFTLSPIRYTGSAIVACQYIFGFSARYSDVVTSDYSVLPSIS